MGPHSDAVRCSSRLPVRSCYLTPMLVPREGTIVEFESNGGVGTIELDDGERVRFGYSVCRFAVPAVGLRVKVIGTEPGFRGVLKARAVEEISPAPLVAPTPPARTSMLGQWQALGVAAEPALLALLRAVDEDATLLADLERMSFELEPMPAAEIDCDHEGLTIVAMDGFGNAFGLWNDGTSAEPLPWALYSHEDDGLTVLAPTTAEFLSLLLDHFTRNQGELEVALRVRWRLEALGVVLQPAGTHQRSLYEAP